MKKAEIFGTLRAQLCPEQVNKIFFFGTRQSFYRRRKSFQTLCLFSFFVWTIPHLPHLRVQDTGISKLFFGYSVVKYHQKRKERRLLSFSFRELSRHRS
jgi:hypothetical protein